jgi:hypothetical protein
MYLIMMALNSQEECLIVMSAMNAVRREAKDTEGTSVLAEEIRAIQNKAIGRSHPSGSLELEIASGQRAINLPMIALIRELTKEMAAHWLRQ